MNACPHCNEPSFSLLRKWWSNSIFPARCAHCGGLARVAVSKGVNIGAGCMALLAIVGVMAGVMSSVAVAAVGALLVAVLYVWLWRLAPLQAITPEVLRSQRRFAWAWIILESIR
jgi:hypothetical protein